MGCGRSMVCTSSDNKRKKYEDSHGKMKILLEHEHGHGKCQSEAKRHSLELEIEKLKFYSQQLCAREADLRLKFTEEQKQLKSDNEDELCHLCSQLECCISENSLLKTKLNLLETSKAEVENYKQEELRMALEENKLLVEKREEDRLSFEDHVQALNTEIKVLKEAQKRNDQEISKESNVPSTELQHLQNELSSLQVVIDIRTQQLHNKEKLVLDLQKEVDEKQVLHQKLQVLQQKYENVLARMHKSMELQRKLSSEQVVLQHSLEQESKINKRLSMEKEDLKWRLVNSTVPQLSPGSPKGPKLFSPSSRESVH
uniref:Uncharacterized protein n=1 Tax=Eptatretus burgeri TaxID=7764 RepID=A0A8C4Q9I2_EPTBU